MGRRRRAVRLGFIPVLSLAFTGVRVNGHSGYVTISVIRSLHLILTSEMPRAISGYRDRILMERRR